MDRGRRASSWRGSPARELEALIEQAIDVIEPAQQPDGYLNSYYTVAEPGRRWIDFGHGHELYCAGHLFQAAVAHHRATGSDRLLNVARRFADHIDATFGPGKRQATPGHPEIETALVELYRETGERRYLALAGFLLDNRGHGWLGPSHRYGARRTSRTACPCARRPRSRATPCGRCT